MWFLYDFEKIIFFDEIMDIWVKEIKEKRKNNCKSKKRNNHALFGLAQQEKRQEKEKQKGPRPHTKG